MKPTWIIEPGVFQENADQLRSIIHKNEMSCIFIAPDDYITHPDQFDRSLPENDSCVVYYGSLGIMQRLRKQRTWTPGFYGTLENLKCSTYFNYFGKWLFNQKYLMMPLVELICKKDEVCEMLGSDKLFVRPDSGFKHFTGFAIDKKDMSLEAFGLGYYYDDPTILVVASNAKNIKREWRFVVCEDRVVTGSRYKTNFQLTDWQLEDCGPDKDALEAAEFVAKEATWRPDSMYVMDICEDEYDVFSLLELNSFSCSGLYRSDLEKVVLAASEQAEKEWKEVNGE